MYNSTYESKLHICYQHWFLLDKERQGRGRSWSESLAFWDLLRHRFSSPTQNILFTESLLTYNRPTSEQRETTVKVQMKNLQLSCWVLWHDEDESGFRRQKKFKSVSNETYCSQAHHPPISLQTVHYISLKNSLASLSVCQRSNHQPWKSTKIWQPFIRKLSHNLQINYGYWRKKGQDTPYLWKSGVVMVLLVFLCNIAYWGIVTIPNVDEWRHFCVIMTFLPFTEIDSLNVSTTNIRLTFLERPRIVTNKSLRVRGLSLIQVTENQFSVYLFTSITLRHLAI